MTCKIRKWKLSDAKDLAMALSNRKILVQYFFDNHILYSSIF